MGLRKITFGVLKSTSKPTALGGVRFYDQSNSMIPSGNVITNEFELGVTDNFTVSSTVTYPSEYYKVLHAFDTNRVQTDGYVSGLNKVAYWFGSKSGTDAITITFNHDVKISRIEYIANPDMHYSDGLTDLPFDIKGYDEDGNLIGSYNTVPNITKLAITEVITPLFVTSENKMLVKANNKVYSLKSEEILYEPKMTSNTAPAPFVASASSVYSTAYPAWKAFNGVVSDTDAWISSTAEASSGWIQIDFGAKTKVNFFTIQNRVTANSAMNNAMVKDFKILGSYDNVNFQEVVTVKNQVSWTSKEKRSYSTNGVFDHRYYRLQIISNNGLATYTHISELSFGYVERLAEIPSASEQNFINYGSTSLDNFNSINTNKNYILQDTVSENADGLWVQEIDRKPLSIKFE